MSELAREVSEGGEIEDGGDVEEVGEGPAWGSLDWLALQPVVTVQGLELPACHRVPDDATLGEPESARCRVVQADGARCKARPTRRYGLCMAHAGGGGFQDPGAMSRRGHAARARVRAERTLLGIGAAGRGSPRAIARQAALRRSFELAAAIVDGPLDDPELGSIARQAAAIRAVDATFPLQSASLEIELPASAGDVQGLSWQDLQALAGRLLGEGEPAGELEG
jgi:hypothetical protein